MHLERHFYTIVWGKRIEILKVFPYRYIRKKKSALLCNDSKTSTKSKAREIPSLIQPLLMLVISQYECSEITRKFVTRLIMHLLDIKLNTFQYQMFH